MRYADSCCTYTETFKPQKYHFTGPCMSCKQPQTVSVIASELYAYRQGQSIQQALSNNADEREFLMSGICPACWKKTFSSPEEDTTFLESCMDPDILADDPEEDDPVHEPDYDAMAEASWREYLADNEESE
jgi:hypothetical protein